MLRIYVSLDVSCLHLWLTMNTCTKARATTIAASRSMRTLNVDVCAERRKQRYAHKQEDVGVSSHGITYSNQAHAGPNGLSQSQMPCEPVRLLRYMNADM